MSNPEDQLREAFESHENMGPDPTEVYARVQQLAKGYRRKRLGAQAAGGAVLSAGLIAGAVNLPSLLPTWGHNNVSVVTAGAPAAPSPSVFASPSPSPIASADLQKDWDAYFNAGYGYDDALKLAQLWNMSSDDVGNVKAEAGRRLLAGETLPIQPGPETPDSGPASVEEQDVTAFFNAGYTYDDAVTLSNLWHTADPYHAKIEGGRRLLAGQTLPIRP